MIIDNIYFEVHSSSSTAVEHLTHNPKINGSNPATNAGTDLFSSVAKYLYTKIWQEAILIKANNY
jgi:hypothetical protein